MTDTAFAELSADSFPLSIEAITGYGTPQEAAVWQLDVPGPGAIEIPPLHRVFGPVAIRLSLATGERHVALPDGDGMRRETR